MIEISDLMDVKKEPGVYTGQFINPFYGQALIQGRKDVEKPIRVGRNKGFFNVLHIRDIILRQVRPQSKTPDFKGSHGFLEGLFKGPANGHGFSNRFHGY